LLCPELCFKSVTSSLRQSERGAMLLANLRAHFAGEPVLTSLT
jgi:hypothetical protein